MTGGAMVSTTGGAMFVLLTTGGGRLSIIDDGIRGIFSSLLNVLQGKIILRFYLYVHPLMWTQVSRATGSLILCIKSYSC